MDARERLAAVYKALLDRQHDVAGLTVFRMNDEADPGLKPKETGGTYETARPVERVESLYLRRSARSTETATIKLDLAESETHYHIRRDCPHESHCDDGWQPFSLEEDYQIGKAGVPCANASQFADRLLSELDRELDRLRDWHGE